jgi:ActR/RegA family two-component response regulator
VAAVRNLLIVEDDVEWRDAYNRTAAKSGAFRVRIAEDLRSAKTLIDEIQFAVAFIDIGLDVNDDKNVDGLRVMEKIRSVDEATSIVVVTGRSGRDVMPITKDALRRYNAVDIVAKPETAPGEIHKLLLSGLEEFEKRLEAAPAGHESLRGDMEQSFWDDEMLRVTRAKGGVPDFYRFIDRLLGSFTPLIPGRAGVALRSDAATQLVHGAYWSRAIGQAIVVCFGADDKLAEPVGAAKTAKVLLEKYPVGEILAEHSAHGLSGVVFALCEASRDQFASSAQR